MYIGELKTKPIRRKSWQPNFYIEYKNDVFVDQNDKIYSLSNEDIFADDWELAINLDTYIKVVMENEALKEYNEILLNIIKDIKDFIINLPETRRQIMSKELDFILDKTHDALKWNK